MKGKMLQGVYKSGLLVAGVFCCITQAWANAQLIQLNTNPMVKGAVEIELLFDSPIENVMDHLEYSPNQLVIDVANASSALKINPLPIESGGVKQVQSLQTESGLQLVLGLERLVPYQVSKEAQRVLIKLGALPVAAAAADSSVDDAFESASRVEHATINTIEAIDFRRGKGGSGQVMIDLNNSSIAADIKRRDNSLLIDFYNTDIAEENVYVMDVNDFATPVESVEVFKHASKVQLKIAIEGDFDYRYDQSGELFMVEVKPMLAEESAKVEYQGKPISLNFQDIPVRTVLQLIADFNKLNLVTTDSVRGNITLRMDDVPWEQALDIILKVKGLDKRFDNNVLLIAPASELAEQERQQLESAQQVADLAPLYSEYIQVNYAKAADLSALLKNEQASMLSERGSVAVDDRTNTLLIKDTEESLANIKAMVERLDIAVKQVVIEARMVTVTDDVSEELGIRWGVTNSGSVGSSTGITSGTLEGADSVLGGAIPDLDDRLNVNLPVADPAGSIAFQVAKLANGQILDLELSALEQENKGEVIASPRITTANQKAAYIEQGREIPYVESASSGATSVTFKKAVLSLRVTPQITPDGNVILDLVITQDSEGEAVLTPTGPAVAINKQEIGTQVLVKNGETVVLGGIYQQQNIDRVKKVPILGDIPGLGYFFRTTSESVTKNELLIFVTPRILLDGL
ncbi:type IV pilus secretin PilQ family protein [Agarivorans sp. TSD2052]|uniref:type IV pilus secretin PilQ n=1 Tax=Agarivorans sp. TSD2052 TaxID=2937286 RepID=UPI00200FB554|nr:type IV pilus secretin PilQ family protein [Agarivorans sp. TSD2052]UPW19153.1 type IV pilus secretin PilQ family protein [Agarivorans sp. TSD2052]